MVNIYLNMNIPLLVVRGHANSAEIGQDLVCCAVSMLVEALSRFMDMKEKEGELNHLTNDIDSGGACITAQPYKRSELEVKGAYELTREGLRALAKEYPDYITLEEA